MWGSDVEHSVKASRASILTPPCGERTWRAGRGGGAANSTDIAISAPEIRSRVICLGLKDAGGAILQRKDQV